MADYLIYSCRQMKNFKNINMSKVNNFEKDLTEKDLDQTQGNVKNTKEDKKSVFKKDSKKTKTEDLAKELELTKAKLEKEKDDYLRLMAEFDNFRRRTAEERINLIDSAAKDTIKGLLPILDDFERALVALEDSADSEAAKEGTELIYNKLMAYLKTKGLEVIEAMGDEFHTDLHEAVAQFQVENEEQKGKVFDVVQTGYTLNGTVIRYAKVVVGI